MSQPSTRLEELLETGGRSLYALLVRLTLSEDAADELLQELVVRLSRSEGFQKADHPLAYARRAAIHLAFDRRRQWKHRPKVEPLLEEPESAAKSPLRLLIDREEFENVLAAMERLSSRSRTCLVLHYTEQLSYTEIAEQFSATPHQIRGICHKAVRRLQQWTAVGLPCEKQTEETADGS
ncbi:MAG: sigma-70 family RNA polymerase sigma factor [Pirellulales bacterium]|nr:sigma-70 family RNA polymerase sigma factor [Pirellulales bacterium]